MRYSEWSAKRRAERRRAAKALEEANDPKLAKRRAKARRARERRKEREAEYEEWKKRSLKEYRKSQTARALARDKKHLKLVT